MSKEIEDKAFAQQGAPLRFDWACNGAGGAVMAALEAAAAGASRFVGGCVRDGLSGVTPHDIDIATQLTPDEVIAAAQRAGLKPVATGLDHGTITVVSHHKGVEVTSLRRDVSTDGRRAVVAFTKDWTEDAQRRDFTINAFYLTADGNLCDPVGGLDDLKARKVRFIGDAEARIREDYLRILRFFRFSARFAESFDEPGFAACARLKGGIGKLSAERVGDELTKILALPNAAFAIHAMDEAGVMAQIWPFKGNIARFERLKKRAHKAQAPLGLAALYGAQDKDKQGQSLEKALRLSNEMGARRRAVLAHADLLGPFLRAAAVSGVSAEENALGKENISNMGGALDEGAARAALYRIGLAAWEDALLLASAWAEQVDETALEVLQTLPSRFTPPSFPIKGGDVLALGVKKGPKVAALLKEVEDQWIDEGFAPAARAHDILKARAKAYF